MKHKIFLSLLLLILAWILPLQVIAATWVVSGAGDSAYNGEYLESGTFNGQPYYTNGARWLYWGYIGYWLLNDSFLGMPPAYYGTGGTGATLPANPWGVGGSGRAPAPTVSLAGSPVVSPAGSSSVNGFAWSDTIGWIKFDHSAPSGQVRLNDGTGMFSGYAWSENIGWIDFAPAGSYPSSPNYSACLDLPGAGQTCDGTGDYTVSGWARALSFGGGWDGWIKLKGTNYGVTLDTGPSPAEFRGYAWGSDVVGWISFNCSNTGVCGTSNYKVTTALALNQPPSVNNPSENLNYCAWGASPQVAEGVSVTLNWTFSDPNSGDTQTAYEVWVDDDSNFTDPKFNYLVDPSSSTAYALNLGNDQAPGDWWASLDFGANYYWKVRVRDNNGSWSNWSSVDSFTLPPHAAPNINFSWSPLNPGVNEKITFSDLSSVYGGAVKSDWSWTFAPDGNPFSSEKETPTSKFPNTGQKTITLELRDSDALVCGGSKTLNIQLPLPEWREIPPFSWVNKLLAMVTSLF